MIEFDDGERVRALEVECKSVRQLMDERDKRYDERDRASKDAVQALAQTQKEQRAAANEWRGTVSDLMGGMVTRKEMMWLVALIVTIAFGLAAMIIGK